MFLRIICNHAHLRNPDTKSAHAHYRQILLIRALDQVLESELERYRQGQGSGVTPSASSKDDSEAIKRLQVLVEKASQMCVMK
jgi:hypothetical protein